MVFALYVGNAYFDWYYWAVSLLCLLPIFIAVIFWSIHWCCVYKHDKDAERASRARICAACYLVVLTFILLLIWNIIYIYCFYGYSEVYMGYGEPATPGDSEHDTGGNYYKMSKGEFVIEQVIETVVVSAFFIYFIVVTHGYAGTSFEMP